MPWQPEREAMPGGMHVTSTILSSSVFVCLCECVTRVLLAVEGKQGPRMQVAHMLPNLRLHPMTQNYLPCREESDAQRRQGRQTVQEEMIVHVCHRVISPCLQRHMSQRATSRSHFLPPLLRPVRVINCLWCLALPGSRR